MSGSRHTGARAMSIPDNFWNSRTLCLCGADARGTLLRGTPLFTSLFGGGADISFPGDLISFIHPEDRDNFLYDLERAGSGNSLLDRKMVRLVTPDGRIVPVTVSGERFDNGGGAGAELVLSWSERADEELIMMPPREAMDDVAAGEQGGAGDGFAPFQPAADPFVSGADQLERFSDLINNFIASFHDPVAILHADGRVADINSAMTELLGYSPAELCGRPVVSLLERDPEKVKQAVFKFIKQMRAGKMRDRPGRWHAKNGEAIPVSMSGSVVRGRSGELIAMILIGRDQRQNALIKDLERKNQDLVRAYEELKALDKMKDDLLSLVGHELRAPLANILGYAEFLREWEVSEEESKDFVRIIYQESHRLSRLVNDILDLSRMEAGRMSYAYITDSVNRVIEAALHSLQPDIEEKGLQVVQELEDQLEPMEFDPDRVQQVATNIIHNAVKFSEPGKKIRVRTEAIEGGARVSVADNGPGIDPKDAAKVWNKFEQIDDVSNHHKGAGLGMAIARQIIEEGHGGRLWFESDGRGRGSIFKFTILERRPEDG